MTRHVHFIGICGKGMGAIAAALARDGWHVTGCDENPRPPMSRHLEANGITIRTPCLARDLPAGDAEIIVGKRMPADHEILDALRRQNRSWTSFPDFLARHFLSRSRNVVVAGGVGKTTTTSLLAHILRQAGQDPDFLIGATPLGFPAPAKLAGAGMFVIEGDEYASCEDDPRPKFLHYHPEVVVITNLLQDHPDLYKDKEALSRAFRSLVALLPSHGLLVVPDDDADAAAFLHEAACPVLKVGYGDTADIRILPREMGTEFSRFQIGEVVFELPMFGQMNVRNAGMAAVAAGHFGVPLATAAGALVSFQGIQKRQETRLLGEVRLIIDKATHPVAITGLFEAVRQRFPGRRLISVLQPRATGGKNWIYQSMLPDTLAGADHVVLFPAYEHQAKTGQQWEGGAFDTAELARATRATGTTVELAPGIGDAAGILTRVVRSGDVVVVTLPEQAAGLEMAILDALRSSAARA
jgi:UDP-N-acetylmuramate: L-alanyl-gamma-D-glutamyl-meso-diaminopimelate ligase